MKPTYVLVTLLALAVFAAPSAAFAGKKNKKKDDAPEGPSAVMKKYDKNGNGTLEDTEKEAIRAAFEKDPDLKVYDKNGDGKLDDAEIAAIAKPTPPADTPKKKKKKKDAQ
jgi:hypothetical protein